MNGCNINKSLISFVLLAASFSCSHDKIKVSSEYFMDDIIHTHGNPSRVDTIILKEGSSLYEYQGGLYKFIPSNDSLEVIEHVYIKGNISLVLWLLPNGNKVKILDMLEWDRTKIQY